MELHLTVCMRCAKQITASKSVWSSQVTLALQAELTVSSVHVFTEYFTHKCWNSSHWYSWCWLKLNLVCWLGLYLFVWLFSLVQNNLDIMSLVIFGWLLLIPSVENLAVLSNIMAMFGLEIFVFHKVRFLRAAIVCIYVSPLGAVRVVWLPETSWHDNVEFKYPSIVYTCVGKYSWKHLLKCTVKNGCSDESYKMWSRFFFPVTSVVISK